MKLNEIIILNILVLGLNLIFIGDNSLMGVINLFTGFYITVGSIIITILSVIKRDKKSIIIYSLKNIQNLVCQFSLELLF